MQLRASRVSIQILIVIAAAAIVLPVRGDATSPLLDLCRSTPGLDSQFARHLLFDDDPEFRRFCEAAGPIPIRWAYHSIITRIWTVAPDSYLACFRDLGPAAERICRELATLYECGDCALDLRFRRALGARGIELNRILTDMYRLTGDAAPPTDAKVAKYRALIAEFEQIGYERGVLYAEIDLAAVHEQRNEMGERARLLRSALWRARRLNACGMVCQLLGMIGFAHRAAGNPDSVVACYLDGIAMADRHRASEQAMRLRLFLASHYVIAGRLALAGQLARDAQDVSRRWGGGAYEYRAVEWTMRFFANLGCWDIVRNHSRRLPVLLRALEGSRLYEEFRLHSLTAQQWEAEMLIAEGSPAEGVAMLSRLPANAMRVLSKERYAVLHEVHAEALIAAGRPGEAMAVIDRGIAYADSFRLVRSAIEQLQLRARAALALGDERVARQALREVRIRLDNRPKIDPLGRPIYDALDIRVSLESGEERVARLQFARSLPHLREAVRDLEAGPDAYLALGRVDALREMGHRLLEGDAGGSYRFELDWRSLAGHIGRDESAMPPATASLPSILNPSGIRSVHAVYGFTEQGLTRWIRSSGTIRREVLDASRAECDRLVDEAMRTVSRDPGSLDMPPTDLAALQALGRLLLPAELRGGHPVRLIVSAEGAIARLPFEALDVGTGGVYEPLLARHEVVYARPVPGLRRRHGRGPSIIVLGEDTGGERAPSLMAAEPEIGRATARLPGAARVVRSGGVSKHDLLHAWSDAPVVYVAAHLARDQETPLLCYFPMRFGARPNHPEDTFLDLRDARTVDLTGTRLVVLSSCASGEPYVVGGRAGPSMADAVLDAGAAAVIHTRWRVRDDRAAIIAPDLAGAWLDPGGDPVSAWNTRRRAMLRGPQGWRHPFEWAAWSVTVGLPTGTWDAGTRSVNVAARRAPPGPAAPGGNRVLAASHARSTARRPPVPATP